MQVLDEDLLQDTCVAYLRNFVDEKVSYAAAHSEYQCFAVRVYDGSNSLYVTFDDVCFSSFVGDSTRATKHPLVGAELLISISAQDVYGRLCQDVEPCHENADGFRQSNRVGDPSEQVPDVFFHHQLIHLLALDVEFVRYAPTPKDCPCHAMGKTITRLTEITIVRVVQEEAVDAAAASGNAAEEGSLCMH